jgi:histidinol phosphatase-like PHP family hydrolase
LCDFHVHTRWSDGRLSVREVVDLYGQTGRFDVIAITDHILMKRDLLARAGRFASLGYRHFSVTENRFETYLEDVAAEAKRARRLYNLLVVPGAEITQNHIRSKKKLAHCRPQYPPVHQRRSAGRRS